MNARANFQPTTLRNIMPSSSPPLLHRGAALFIAIVLLAVLGIVAGIVLPQILRDRQEFRQDLLRTQSRLLLNDALHIAETKRKSDPDFSGENFILGPDIQPFNGTFRVVTRLEEDAFVGEVQYRDNNGNVLVFVSTRNFAK